MTRSHKMRREKDEVGASASVPAPVSAPGAAEEQGSPLDRLRGLLREEMAAYGGGEALLKWLRTDPEPGEHER